MNKPVIDHLGNEYKSIKSMAMHYGLPDYVVSTRIKKGWTMQEVLTTPCKQIVQHHFDKNNISDHMGNIFNSQKEMCEYWNVDRNSFDKRLQSGWSVEKALTTPTKKYKKKHFERNAIIDHEGNKFNSQKEMCEYWKIDKDAFSKRLDSGWTLEDALTKPKGYNPQKREKTKCADHMGNEFDSLAEMANAYGISPGTVYSRLQKGWTVEEALQTVPNSSKACCDHLGREFKSLNELCKFWNISKDTYQRKIRQGWSVEEVLTKKRVYPPQKKVFDHMGNEFASTSEMCSYWGVNRRTFADRIKSGATVEKALTYKHNAIKDHYGNEFSSIAELCNYWEISYADYKLQRSQGKTMQECIAICSEITKKRQDGISLRPSKPCTDHLGNNFLSITEMCTYWNISIGLFLDRMDAGWSIEDALTKEKTHSRTKIVNCVDHLGNTFADVQSMCDYWGIKKVTFTSRVQRGKSIEEALTGSVQQKHCKDDIYTDHKGNVYDTLQEMLDYWNVSRGNYFARLQRGCSLEEVLTGKIFSKHTKDMEYGVFLKISYAYADGDLLYFECYKADGHIDFLTKEEIQHAE